MQMRRFFQSPVVVQGTRKRESVINPIQKIGAYQEQSRTRVFDPERAKQPERVMVHFPTVSPNPIKNYRPTGVTHREVVEGQERNYRANMLGRIKGNQIALEQRFGRRIRPVKKNLGRVATHSQGFGLADKGDVSAEPELGMFDRFILWIQSLFK